MATLERLAPPAASQPASPAWSPRRAIVTALILAVTIALLQVIQSSHSADTGQRLQLLEAQRVQLTAQIHEMEGDVAALSSLDRIERGARDRLGMVPARNISYLSVAEEAPSGPLLPRPILTPGTTPQIQDDPWWQSLFKALPIHLGQ